MRRAAAWSLDVCSSFPKVLSTTMVVVLAAPACRSVPPSARTPSGGAAVTAATANVRVPQVPGTVTVSVGQTIGVPPRGGEWQVDFDNERLELLTPAESLSSPGETGWVWRAKRAGTAEIVFTSRVRCVQPPCAPAAAQLSLSIVIK